MTRRGGERGPRINARALRAFRLQRAWTQVDLAKASGVHHSYVSRLEAGQRYAPDPSATSALAGALGVEVSDLLASEVTEAGKFEELQQEVAALRRELELERRRHETSRGRLAAERDRHVSAIRALRSELDDAAQSIHRLQVERDQAHMEMRAASAAIGSAVMHAVQTALADIEGGAR